MDLLRFTTAGSVDDGKSTLIGRLLYDSKSLFDDTLESLKGYNTRRGEEGFDLALVTDGLRSEREQGITIDVAYRYFSTPRRQFIIADTPGHQQYTRNMVTGASTADLAIVLIDATLGVQVQSKRHGFLAALLGIPHIVVAVNKMDLVGFSQKIFDAIVEEYSEFCDKLIVPDVTYLPVSALLGDNVVERSPFMPWYSGPTLLGHLETVHVAKERNPIDFRLPVQTVIRPHQDFRGYAGLVASGSVHVGDEVMTLPTGRKSRVTSLLHSEESVSEARAGSSVVVTLADDIDVGRGDMLVRAGNLPLVGRDLDATICWMDETKALTVGASYLVLHTTKRTRAVIENVQYRVSVDTLHRETTDSLSLNEIGRVTLKTADPLFYDEYRINRATGGFILVDPFTFRTVGAGMLRNPHLEVPSDKPVANVVWDHQGVGLAQRTSRNTHRPFVLWMTGLSGSGKSTLAGLAEAALFNAGYSVVRLDGDNLRHGLCSDLGFSEEDRHENLRRAGHVARLLFGFGHVVLCTFISPYRQDRDLIRALFQPGEFAEAFVKCSLNLCQERDPKGLYEKARKGQLVNMTGVDSPYEEPTVPELVLDTENHSAEQLTLVILDYIRRHTR
jgi:bifunctional enzyme CysN/CysC